jgi:hypothetical protein
LRCLRLKIISFSLLLFSNASFAQYSSGQNFYIGFGTGISSYLGGYFGQANEMKVLIEYNDDYSDDYYYDDYFSSYNNNTFWSQIRSAFDTIVSCFNITSGAFGLHNFMHRACIQ